MAIIRSRLANPATLPTTVGSIYSNPASTRTAIKGIELFNSGTGNETVRLYNVPDVSGSLGTAGNTNQILEITLAAKEKFIYESPGDGRWLEDTNDSIQGSTTTASTVVYEFFGVKDA
jgi:hypothetical protein